jgi:hypothetical protein
MLGVFQEFSVCILSGLSSPGRARFPGSLKWSSGGRLACRPVVPCLTSAYHLLPEPRLFPVHAFSYLVATSCNALCSQVHVHHNQILLCDGQAAAHMLIAFVLDTLSKQMAPLQASNMSSAMADLHRSCMTLHPEACYKISRYAEITSEFTSTAP